MTLSTDAEGDTGERAAVQLERVWREAAARIGFQVVRTPDAYAAFDGGGRILIGTPEVLDADDWVPQLVFHELCHAAVEGVDRIQESDWGLSNDGDEHVDREQACLRLQAALATPMGLRQLMAPTTSHRSYYQGLPPLALAGEGSVVEQARKGYRTLETHPFFPHVANALIETQRIVAQHGGIPLGVGGAQLPALESPWQVHPSGFFSIPNAFLSRTASCQACAWYDSGGGECKKARATVPPDAGACERFEASLECGACGACCREGFDVVELGAEERFLQRHGAMIVEEDGRLQLPRPGGVCVALASRPQGTSAFRCNVYEDRPDACRAFEVAGENCLLARKRTGLSV